MTGAEYVPAARIIAASIRDFSERADTQAAIIADAIRHRPVIVVASDVTPEAVEALAAALNPERATD